MEVDPPKASQEASGAGAEAGGKESNPNKSSGGDVGDPTLGTVLLLEDWDLDEAGREGLGADFGGAAGLRSSVDSTFDLSNQDLSMYFL